MIREHDIPFDELSVTPADVYRAMGYGTETPGEEIGEIVEEVLECVASFMTGRCMYCRVDGVLEKHTLRISRETFGVGAVIARQLKGSEFYLLFAATAGQEFDQWLEKTKRCNDIVLHFIADSLGSCLAEKVAGRMETYIGRDLALQERKHTNRFSPGYCGWQVSEQQKLFSLFPTPTPCGIRLTASSLMIPIKSVSGIIGAGAQVKKQEYNCGRCAGEGCCGEKRNNV